MTEWETCKRCRKEEEIVGCHECPIRDEAEAKLAAEEDHSRILEIALDRCEDVLHGACDDKRVLIEKLAAEEAEIKRLKDDMKPVHDFERQDDDGRDSGE